MPPPTHPLPCEPPDDGERPASASSTEPMMHGEADPTDHDPYAALRYPAYRWISIGWMISVIGQQMQSAAIGWEIYSRVKAIDETNAKLALGYVAGIQVIPLFALALPAGTLADRFDRRWIIGITSILSACCSLGLADLSHRTGSIPLMYLMLLLGAASLVIGRPARAALLPNTVPDKAFTNAVTWNSSFFQVATMIGPAVGGLLLIAGAWWCYLADAAAALIFAWTMLMMPKLHAPAHSGLRTQHSGLRTQHSGLNSLFAGVHFVWQTRILLATLSLDLFAVLLGGAAYLLPIFAKDILHVGPVGFGWLRAAEAVGAFTTALILAHLPPMKHAGRNMLLAVCGFGIATIIFGLSQIYALSFAMLFLIGAFDNISVVVRHTLVQTLTPDSMRGRVSAVNQIFIGSSNELGGLESGLTAAWFGPVISVVGGGIGTLLVIGAVALLAPGLRKFGTLQRKPTGQK